MKMHNLENNWNGSNIIPEGEEPYVLVEDFSGNLYIAGYNFPENTFTDLHKNHFDDILEVKRWKYININ